MLKNLQDEESLQKQAMTYKDNMKFTISHHTLLDT